jgi:hypothetical protein
MIGAVQQSQITSPPSGVAVAGTGVHRGRAFAGVVALELQRQGPHYRLALECWQALSSEQLRGFPPLCPDVVIERVSPRPTQAVGAGAPAGG